MPVRKARNSTRIGPTQIRMQEKRFYGEEPEYPEGVPLTDAQISKSFNWYNYMVELSEARQFLIDYLTDQERHEDATTFKVVPDYGIPVVAAWIARLASKGYDLPFSCFAAMDNKIEHAKKYIPQQPTVISIDNNDRRKRISAIIAEIDTLIDSNELKLRNFLLERNLPKNIAEPAMEHFSEILGDYKAIASGDDAELAAQYNVPPDVLAHKIAIFEQMMLDFEDILQIKRKERKPRQVSAKKAIDPDIKFKFFKHMEFDAETGLRSFDVKEIMGAHEVWLYNTRYTILTVLYAKTDKGFDVERMTILNVDAAKSTAKRLGKRANSILPNINSLQRSKLRSIFDMSNNSFQEANDRTHENILFLRVFRGML